MGYFSFTCAKTGLPIVSHDQGADPKHFTVYVIPKQGRASKGSYDGYGRLVHSDMDEPMDIGGPEGDKMVLAHFFKGESWAELRESKSEPDQGAYDEVFHPALFAAVELIPGFDGHQYVRRLRELERLQSAAREHLAQVHGFTYSHIFDLRQALGRAEYADPEDRVGEEQAAWAEATAHFPQGVVPAGNLVHGMSPQEALATLEATGERMYIALVTELVSAWGENRPTHQPVFSELLSGRGAGWTQLAPAPARPRMKA